MANYTFEALSPADFEDLTRDLLQAELGVRFQSFAQGPDGGIDLLCNDDGKSIVVQCKHYAKSGLRALLRSMKAERQKLEALRPDRYLISTTVRMTPDRKRQLLEVVTPFCRSAADIFGPEDLNNLLGCHVDVERRHPRLWLPTDLGRVLHPGLTTLKQLEEQEIQDALRVYVRTSAHEEVTRRLNELHYCIIAGAPGVGKTTLARAVLAELLRDGFDLIVAVQDVAELIAQLSQTRRQALYFDDFLGQTSLRDRNVGSHAGLRRVVRAVARDPDKRLILTTREYILSEAQLLHEDLASRHMSLAKCLVDVGQFTSTCRARILYNHLYFSNLPNSHVAAIANGPYRRIIYHRNFNPRVIEWMTESLDQARSPKDYVTSFYEALSDPEGIWAHAYSQVPSTAKKVLLGLATLPDLTTLKAAKNVWENLLRDQYEADPIVSARVWQAAIKQLDGSFIQTLRLPDQDDIVVEFANPSIRDFVMNEIVKEPEIATFLLDRSQYFEQLERLCATGSDSAASPGAHDRLVERVQQLLRREPSTVDLAGAIAPTDSSLRVTMLDRLASMAGWSSQLRDLALSELTSNLWTLETPGELAALINLVSCFDDNEISVAGQTSRLSKLLQDALVSRCARVEHWHLCAQLMGKRSSFMEELRTDAEAAFLRACELECAEAAQSTSAFDRLVDTHDQIEETAEICGFDVTLLLEELKKSCGRHFPNRAPSGGRELTSPERKQSPEVDTKEDEIRVLFEGLARTLDQRRE